jgi:small subunit ribosomal protein S8
MKPLAKLLSNIQTGVIVKHFVVNVPRTKLNLEVLNLLHNEGFIDGFGLSKTDPKNISVFLRYKDGVGVLKKLKLISTPGRRIYVSYDDIVKKLVYTGFFVISTSPDGVLCSDDYVKRTDKFPRAGGELLFQVFF